MDFFVRGIETIDNDKLSIKVDSSDIAANAKYALCCLGTLRRNEEDEEFITLTFVRYGK